MSVVETRTWTEQVKIDPKVNDAYQMAWSPDARYFAVGGGESGFGPPSCAWIVDAQSGKVLRRFGQYNFEMRAIAWSPDSERIALTRATRESDGHTDVIDVHDRRTGKVLYELEGPGSHVFALHWKQDGRTILAVGYTGNGLYLWEWTLPSGATQSGSDIGDQ